MAARGLGVHCGTEGLARTRHACRRSVACSAAERKRAANDRALERYLRNRVKQLGTFVPPPPGTATGGPQQQQLMPPPDTAVLLTFLRRQMAEGISNEAEPPPQIEPPVAGRGTIGAASEQATDGAGEARRRGGKKAAAAAGTGARKGVVVQQPAPYPDERRTMPLPDGIAPSSAAAGDATVAAAGDAAAAFRLVHVFWDVESAHPGDDRDPRLAAAELMRLARRVAEPPQAQQQPGLQPHLAGSSGAADGRSDGGGGSRGRVVGAYAYANRPGWTWVPTVFLDAYAGVKTAAGSSDGASIGDGTSGASASGSASEDEAGRGSRGGAGGRPRCPVCGRQVAAGKLASHIKQLHPDQRAGEALAEAAVARHAAAVAGDAGAADDAATAEAEALAAGPGPGSSSSPLRRQANKAGTSRSRSRGNPSLGAVAAYYSSGGQLYRPPAGHQLVLKYVLAREGFEPRVVQNADGASDRAVNGGVDRLLAALRNAGGGGGGGSRRLLRLGGGADAGATEVTVVLVSGSRRHGAALEGCRRLGVRTVLVAPRRLLAALEAEKEAEAERKEAGKVALGVRGRSAGRPSGPGVDGVASGGDPAGADVVLEWEALAGGRYIL